MIDPAHAPPPPQGLITERDPVALSQLLRRQRRPTISIPLRRQPQRRVRRREPSVRRRPPSPVRQPLVPRLLHPLDETPDRRVVSPSRVPALTCVNCCSLAWRITDSRLRAVTRMMTLSSPTIRPSI